MSKREKILREFKRYGFKESHGGGGIKRLILWIIIILVILWFVKREIILNLFELVKNLF